VVAPPVSPAPAGPAAPAPASAVTPIATLGAAPPADEDPVPRVLQAVARRRQVLAAHLGEAQALRFADRELRIYQAPGESWLAAALERPGNRTALEESLAEVCGNGAGWRVVVGEAPRPAAAADAPGDATSASDPAVQAVLDIFGGSIQAVEARGAEE
jgi:hypothetical protein